MPFLPLPVLILSLLPTLIQCNDTVQVTMTTTVLSPIPIPTNFASFSLEINEALYYFGTSTALNLPFINLLNVLRNVSGPGSLGPSIRIGGNSADVSVFFEGSPPLPPNQTYAITREDMKAYAQSFPLFNGKAVLDTSMFFYNSTTYPVAHVRGVDQWFGWENVEGVEIGNEIPIYHDSGVRPNAWSEEDYELEFDSHVTAMVEAGMPKGMIQGATFCCNNTQYNAALPAYTKKYAEQGVISSISYHYYSIGGCHGGNVELWELMLDKASVLPAQYMQPFVTACLESKVKFKVGEGNSVSCGGRAGVSDVFGTALYSLDVMANMAKIGTSQWNWHGGPHAHYAPISFNKQQPPGPPDVRPLFYGMWAFTAAVAHNSVATSSLVDTPNPFIKVHTFRDEQGVYRVLVIHKDANSTAPADVHITPPPGGSTPTQGNLTRLLAPFITSNYNVSWGGQTFDGSEDGLPLGEVVTEVVGASGGVFTIRVPPASAALFAF